MLESERKSGNVAKLDFYHLHNCLLYLELEGIKKWQISVHAIFECLLICFRDYLNCSNLIFQFQFRFVKLKIWLRTCLKPPLWFQLSATMARMTLWFPYPKENRPTKRSPGLKSLPRSVLNCWNMCPSAGYLSTNLFLHITIISDVNAGKGPFNNYVHVDKM